MAVQPALSEVLSSSPLAVMERHAETCLDCVTKLMSYFEAAQAGDWNKAEKLQLEISRLEGIADEIKMDVRKFAARIMDVGIAHGPTRARAGPR
jgi:uncharacterized protein Yka (UPF0111/DUF47 family)